MNFEDTVYELMASTILMPGLGPNILLHHLENYYELCIYIRESGSNEITTEALSNSKEEIVKTLISCGFNKNGEVIGSSQIHENMSSLLAKECPALVVKNKIPFEKGTWGGVMDSNLFFQIWEDPNKIDVMCNGNPAVKTIWGAYFYLLGVGEASVNFYRKMDTFDEIENDKFQKAAFLCPNEKWISEARRKIQDLRLLYQKENQSYKGKIYSVSSKKVLAAIGYGVAGYFIVGFLGVIIGWIPAILFSISYENMIGWFAISGAALGFSMEYFN